MTKTHIIAIIVVIGSILASAGLTPAIAASAGRHRLAYTEQAEQGDPPNVAIGIAMGAFRGLFVNYLWIRANALKEEGKHHEAIELAKAITSLQPRFPRVWVFHAWNMSYNISVTTQTPEERWQWVQAGIRLLRDEGIPANPGAMLLYKELGWIYTHKINGYTDDSNQFYKRKVAEEWTNVLGTPPRSASGISPREEVVEAFAQWLQSIADAPDLLSQVVDQEPSVQALVDELESRLGLEPDLGLLRRWTFHTELADSIRLAVVEPSFSDRQRTMAEIVANPEHEAAWAALIPHVRKRVLIDEYKMEPKRMIRYTRKFGPMDWRSPASHALYWAYNGVEAGLSTATESNVEGFDFVNTDRIVVHAIQELWRFGEIYFNYADFTTGLTGYYMAMPNPYFVQTYGEHLDEFRQRGGIFESADRAYSPYSAGYKNFLQDAIAFFYRRGQRAEAEKWAEELRNFPFLNLNDPDMWARIALPLDEFVDSILFDRFASPQVATNQVTASLQGAYLNGLLAGNSELFRGMFEFSKRAHAYYMQEQFREVIAAGGISQRTEFLDRNFQVVAGNVFAGTISMLNPDDASSMYLRADPGLQRYAYDPLRDRYERIISEIAEETGETFDEMFPEPPGMDAHRQFIQQQQLERTRDRPQDIRQQ
jgi:hypothetical protein